MATFTKKGAAVLEGSNTVKETRIITAEGYRRAHGRGIKTKTGMQSTVSAKSSSKPSVVKGAK